MATYTEEELYDMDDEQLEVAMSEFTDSVTEDDTPEVDDSEQPELESEVIQDTESEEDNLDINIEGDTPTEEVVDTTPDIEVKKDLREDKVVYKANGKEYEFSDEEVRKQFPTVFGQAMNYTQKMQVIKDKRVILDALDEANLTQKDINFLIDVSKGDKAAITELIKKNGIDTLELDLEDSVYTPKEYGRSDKELEINDIVTKLESDPSFEKTKQILTKDWDPTSWDEFAKNPRLIEELNYDVANGTFDKVQSIADKIKVYDNSSKSDIEYYLDAASILDRESKESAVVESKESTFNPMLAAVDKISKELTASREANVAQVKKQEIQQKRKDAATTRKTIKSTKQDINSYMEIDDSDFDAWYKKINFN